MSSLTGKTRHRIKRGIFGGTKLVLQVEEAYTYYPPYHHYDHVQASGRDDVRWRDATANDVIKGDLQL